MPTSAILFGLASFVAAIASLLIFNSAKSAIHEIDQSKTSPKGPGMGPWASLNSLSMIQER